MLKALSAISTFLWCPQSVRLNGSSVTRMSIRVPILLVSTSIWPQVASLFKAVLQRTDELSCKDNINGERALVHGCFYGRF